MKKLIFVTMLLISMLPLLANLAFDEPVPLYDFDNYELDGQSVLCPNGNLVVFYKQSKQGVRNTFMQIYSPEYQTLLIEPVMFASEIA